MPPKKEQIEFEHEVGGENEETPNIPPLITDDTITITIKKRFQWSMDSLNEKFNFLYTIPHNTLNFYVVGLDDAESTPMRLLRYKSLEDIAKIGGMQILSCGFRLHSLMPQLEDVKTIAATATETSSLQILPFLEIFKDTSHAIAECVSSESAVKLKNWLKDPQLMKYATNDSVSSNYPYNLFNNMEQMRIGDTKAYTWNFNVPGWFAHPKSIGDKFIYIPQHGGNQYFMHPPVQSIHPHSQGIYPIFFRPCVVYDAQKKPMKFKIQLFGESQITLRFRLPPDGHYKAEQSAYETVLMEMNPNNSPLKTEHAFEKLYYHMPL